MTRDDYVLEAVLGVVKLSLSTKIREVRDGVKKRASKKIFVFDLQNVRKRCKNVPYPKRRCGAEGRDRSPERAGSPRLRSAFS